MQNVFCYIFLFVFFVIFFCCFFFFGGGGAITTKLPFRDINFDIVVRVFALFSRCVCYHPFYLFPFFFSLRYCGSPHPQMTIEKDKTLIRRVLR